MIGPCRTARGTTATTSSRDTESRLISRGDRTIVRVCSAHQFSQLLRSSTVSLRFFSFDSIRMVCSRWNDWCILDGMSNYIRNLPPAHPGSHLGEVVDRHRIPSFFASTSGFSWAFWIGVAAGTDAESLGLVAVIPALSARPAMMGWLLRC